MEVCDRFSIAIRNSISDFESINRTPLRQNSFHLFVSIVKSLSVASPLFYLRAIAANKMFRMVPPVHPRRFAAF